MAEGMLTETQERTLVSGLGLFIVIEYLNRNPLVVRTLSISFPQPGKVVSAAITLALLILLTGCAWGLGRGVTRLVRLPELRSSDRALWQIALGNILLSYLILLLGSLHLLLPQVLVALLVVPLVGLAPDMGRWIKAVRRSLSGGLPARPSALQLGLGALAIVLLGRMTLDALWPDPGWDGLTYHLALAERYLFANDIATNPFHMASVFPQNMEMLFVFGLGLKGPILAKLIHFQFALLTLWGVHSAASRFSRRAGIIAPLCLAANPLFLLELSWAYNDLSNAFYALMAVAAVSKPKLTVRDLFFAGLFAGACAGSRYLGAMISIGLCLALLWAAPKAIAASVRNCVWIGGTSFVLLVPWLIRNWYFTGNPVSPMFQDVFHVAGAEYFNPIAVAQLERMIDLIGMGRGLLDFFVAPWNVTMATTPGVYTDSFGPFIGPLHLVAVIAALICGRVRKNKDAQLLLRLVFIWFVAWFASSQESRYLAHIFPLTSILAAVTFDALLPKTKLLRKPQLAWALIAIPLLAFSAEQIRSFDNFGIRYGTVLGHHPLPSAHLPSARIDRAADFVRSESGPTDRLLMLFDSRGYSFHGLDYIPYFTDYASPVLQLVHDSKDVTALHCKLADLGVTQIMVNAHRTNKIVVEGYQEQDFEQDFKRINKFLAQGTEEIWSEYGVSVMRMLPTPEQCAYRR